MNTIDTAIILAGGKSSRMGFDKQLIEVEGKLIIELAIQQLTNLFSEIIIVSNTPDIYKSYGCIVVQDEYSGYGPLAGIHVGLEKSSSMFNYIIACDMPFIQSKYIEYMRNKVKGHSYNIDAVVARFGQWIEPFNAIYSKRLLPIIINNIKLNKRKIGSVLEKANIHYIEEQEARVFSPDWRMFTNINTKDDLCGLLKTNNEKE